MEKALIRTPREPHAVGSPREVEMQESAARAVIAIFIKFGMTYEVAFRTLELINEKLLFNSQFVSIQEQEE